MYSIVVLYSSGEISVYVNGEVSGYQGRVPMRTDARDNRARILDVARATLAEDGSTSTNRIAQLAGVGPGTLYRHFPTREALVLAVYQSEIDALVEAVPRLLDTAPPLEVLRLWTIDLVDAMRRKHGLGDALSPGAHQSVIEQTYEPVLSAISLILDAGVRDHTIRSDAHAGDFLQLTGALWRAATGPTDRSGPMLQLILDGLAKPVETMN
jgi:AcrR family transcriptional regulator